MSDFHSKGKTEDRGQYPRGFGPPRLKVELTGFETAKVNRTQRSSSQGGQAGGGFGNQNSSGGAAQSAPQDDPWAVPTASNAGGWGNGPDSEPPF